MGFPFRREEDKEGEDEEGFTTTTTARTECTRHHTAGATPFTFF
jgi:hypothetical protein